MIDTESKTEKNCAEGENGAYESVMEYIRRGEIDAAQRTLDEFRDRDAEWHYLQACVYYKRNWLGECKKHLEEAIRLDGENAKYREAYEKLNARAEYENAPDRETEQKKGRMGCCETFCYGICDGIGSCC